MKRKAAFGRADYRIIIASSCGVRSPSELCGRSVLYSIRQFSIIRLACAIVTNQCSFKHSSRNLPLKDSM